MRSLIRQRPLASYFVLAFAISWGSVLVIVAPTGIPGPADKIAELFVPVYLANLAGPPAAAIIVSYAIGGVSSVVRLLSSQFTGAFRLRWLALALFAVPTTGLLVLEGLALMSPEFLPGIATTSTPLHLLAFALVGGLAAGFVEEIGWTGFALPRALTRWSLVGSALAIGVLHGVWHLAAGYWGEGEEYGGVFPAYFGAFWLAGLVGLRMIIVSIYAQTRSLALAQLAHASYTGGFVLLWPLSSPPVADMLWSATFALSLLAVATMVLLSCRRSLPVATTDVE